MMTFGERVSITHYAVIFAASERMESDLRSAKNKAGIVQKYLHTIPARSKPDWIGDPFDFDEKTDVDSLYTSAAIGIGMHMHDRLMEFQG